MQACQGPPVDTWACSCAKARLTQLSNQRAVESPHRCCIAQIVPWFNFSVPGAMHLMVLTLTAASAFGCYLAAVITDPGACAPKYTPIVVYQSSRACNHTPTHAF